MKHALGSLLLLCGLIGAAVGVIGLLDPAGTKMADDADPFGPPASSFTSVVVIAGGLTASLLGRRLLRR